VYSSHAIIIDARLTLPAHQDCMPRDRPAPCPGRLQPSLRDQVSKQMQEHERLVNELRNAGLRQKARMASLQQELADSNARLAATNPRKAERLLSEVGQLRETVGTLSAYKVQPLDGNSPHSRVKERV
jgi:hypothetical protein